MEPAVGGHRAAAVRPGLPVEVGERAAGLAHQDVERREIPQRHLGLGGDVDGALGHQAVGPEVAVAAHPPHGVGEIDEPLPQAQLPQPVEAGERQARRPDVGDTGGTDMRRVAAAERRESALAVAGPPAPLQRGRAHHADDRDAVVQQRDQRRPHRHAADEVLGAVDRVDHPLPAGENRCATELFAEYRIVWPLLPPARLAQRGFHRVGRRR